MDKIKLAYIAGLMDADGNISIVKRQWSQRTDKYHLQARLGMCEKEAPYLLKELFGGSIDIRKHPNPNHRDLYTWQTSHKSASRFLQYIVPYLIIKKAQAELGIKFQEHKYSGGGKGLRGRPPKSESEFELEESLYLAMRQLKNGSHKSLNNR